MGQFKIRVTVAHPSDPAKTAEVDLIVDTGATLSWIPKDVLERLAVPRVGRRAFMVADGRTVERETVAVIVRLDGVQANVTVVAAEPTDGHLLGATSLESLGFAVDPIHQRLVPQTLLAM